MHASPAKTLCPDPRICGAATSADEFLQYLAAQPAARKSLTHFFTFEQNTASEYERPSLPVQQHLLFDKPASPRTSSARVSETIKPRPAPHPPTLAETYHYHRLPRTPAGDSNGPTFVDLFCGAGGLSLGLERAGLRPSLAIDNDPWSVLTYGFNRPWLSDDCILTADISRLSPLRFADVRPDVLCAGIPCQPFSNANQQRKAKDQRLSLFEHFLRWVDALRPSAILVENVTGFTTVSEEFVTRLSNLRYAVAHCVVDAADFGVPQSRRRLIYLATRDKMSRSANQSPPLAELLADVASADHFVLGHALEGLPELSPNPHRNQPEYEAPACGYGARRQSASQSPNAFVCQINRDGHTGILYNHKARFNNARDIEIFSLLTPGEDSTAQSIKHIMPYGRRQHIFKDKYYRLRADRLSRTITSHMRYDCNAYIHPQQPRGLTAREAARIQSFPDAYVFCGTFQRVYQQVGNAVPPLLAEALGHAVRSALQQ